MTKKVVFVVIVIALAAIIWQTFFSSEAEFNAPKESLRGEFLEKI